MAKMLGPRVGRLDTLLTKRDEGRSPKAGDSGPEAAATGEGVAVSRSVRGDPGSPASMPPKSIAALGSMPPRSIPPGPADAYSDLLRDTRGLRREQSHAREQWIARLPENRRDEALFELEVLLKGLACFANPRNHPGPPRRAAIVAQDYREALALARDGMTRVVALCRLLLGEQERAFVFQRYLEMLLPDDSARSRLVRGTMTQDTPEESLFLLRHALTNLLEVTGGVTRLPRVPFRLFYATLSVAHREVSQSAFFNPLAALEFRPEFDRITNVRVLELMRQVPGEQARRLVALTFLSLFRMLRYLALLEHVVREPRPAGVVYLSSACSAPTRARSPTTCASRPASSSPTATSASSSRSRPRRSPARYDEMMAEAHRLLTIKSTLGGIAANVRLELRRTFEHDLPPADGSATSERAARGGRDRRGQPAARAAERRARSRQGARRAARRARRLRRRRGAALAVEPPPPRRVDVRADRPRVRREGALDAEPRGSLERPVVAPVRARVPHVLRRDGLPAAARRRLSALRRVHRRAHRARGDRPPRSAAPRARRRARPSASTCSSRELFEQIGQRDELKDVPFDRRAAAEALKLYLGD